MSDVTMHHMGNGFHSPCGLEPASVYHGFQGGFTNVWGDVGCPACLAKQPVVARPVTLGEFWAGAKVVHFTARPSAAYPYKCGAAESAGVGSVMYSEVTCSDCLDLIQGVGTPTPQKPPKMGDMAGDDDGVFVFYDVHTGIPLEMVPQTTGNIEITLGGTDYTLSHLDRADMIRALLYDFHYSPERGGPQDDTTD